MIHLYAHNVYDLHVYLYHRYFMTLKPWKQKPCNHSAVKLYIRKIEQKEPTILISRSIKINNGYVAMAGINDWIMADS